MNTVRVCWMLLLLLTVVWRMEWVSLVHVSVLRRA
jgi:hypothetical protein